MDKDERACKWTRELEVAVAAAREAGEVIRAGSSGLRTAKEKGSTRDLVTETDEKCEELIRKKLSDAFEDYAFIGEEEAAARGGIKAETLGDEPTWMVDPLDGTTNFVHNFPFSCVSIALVVKKKPVVGVVHNPHLRETYTAVRGGGGVRLNGELLRTSGETDLGRALIATEVGVYRDDETVEAVMARLRCVVEKGRSLRCCGAAAMNLAGVATGRLDAFYEVGFGGPWDVAAGALFVEEAGGVVVDPFGGEFNIMARRVLAAATPELAHALAALLAACPRSSVEP